RTILVDVGANIGTVCIPALLRGYFQGALAVEPEAKNFRLLTRNVSANHLAGRVMLFQRAISNAPGVLTMTISADNFGDHRIASAGHGAISVVATTMDAMLSEAQLSPESVGLVWVDVQGHEFQVLQGSETLIQAGVPFVVEFSPNA